MLAKWFLITLPNPRKLILKIKYLTQSIMIQGHLGKCVNLLIAFSGNLRMSEDTSSLRKERSHRKYPQVRLHLIIIKRPPQRGLPITLIFLTLIIIFVVHSQQIIPRAVRAEAGMGGKGASNPSSSNQQIRDALQNSQNSAPKYNKGKKGKYNKLFPLLLI